MSKGLDKYIVILEKALASAKKIKEYEAIAQDTSKPGKERVEACLKAEPLFADVNHAFKSQYYNYNHIDHKFISGNRDCGLINIRRAAETIASFERAKPKYLEGKKVKLNEPHKALCESIFGEQYDTPQDNANRVVFELLGCDKDMYLQIYTWHKTTSDLAAI